MGRLLACPFCRALFGDDEAAECPDCDVALAPMEKLPPSLEAMAEAAADGELIRPEERRLSIWYRARGRGALLVLGALGLALFFAPWVEMAKPYDALISGYDMARARAGWLWGGAVAWFILIPLVASRRTILEMRGVRVITAMFAATSLVEIIVLLSIPPQGHRYVPIEFSWGWGLYATGIVSILGILFAARFGGRLDDLPRGAWEDPIGNVRVDRGDGEVLH